MTTSTPARSALVGDAILLLTAAIWGSGFIAQKLGMLHMGPLAFNGARFLLAALLLAPWMIRWLRGVRSMAQLQPALQVGAWLTTGAALQQIGMVTTSAGEAGFLTSLYIVFVAILGVFIGRAPTRRHWFAAALAIAGAYLLSAKAGFQLDLGAVTVTVGAIAWAMHILTIDVALRKGIPATALAGFQFLFCGVMSSLLAAVAGEPGGFAALAAGWQPILYSGALVVALGYSLQVVGQRSAPPAHAAILLSMEAVFAALLGWWFLHEHLSARGLVGCGLILAAVFISEWRRGAQT